MQVLEGVRVVDLGAGMACALAARFLADLGASVVRFEPAGGDPFYDIYPAYRAWRAGADIHTAGDGLDQALAAADICLTGGEDHPGLPPRRDADALAGRWPKLVVLDIGGYPPALSLGSRPAVDSLVQARSGLAWEHYSDRPIRFAFPAPTYGAVLQGLAGVCAALLERETSGLGQLVSTSLFEGALMWMTPHWHLAERADAALKAKVPKDPIPLVFRCRDGRLIHFMLGSTGALGKLHGVLGIVDENQDMAATGLPTGRGDPRKFFGDVDRYAPIIAERDSAELLAALKAQGLAAEPVLEPGACWDDPQLVHNGLLVTDEAGVTRVGAPVRFAANGADEPRIRHLGGRGPLEGLRVVDFGALIAGPYGSKLLGDLGASVIKVEPLGGEQNRLFMRGYIGANRGKRPICIDLKSPEGRDIAQAICRGADVVQHNFRPGVARRLGVDAETLQALNPGVVVVETSGYGPSGPKAELAGFDMVFQAYAGHEHRTLDAEGRIAWFRSANVDFTGGAIAAIASLAALYRQARGGERIAVFNNLFDASVYLLAELVRGPDGTLAGAPSLNPAQTGMGPADQIYRARDGWIALAVRSPAQAAGLARALSLAAFERSPDEWDEVEEALIAAAIAGRETEPLLAAFEREGVWAEPCLQDAEARYLDDPALQAAGVTLACDDPAYGRLRQVGVLSHFSRTPAADADGCAAAVGADTDAILGELGYDAAAIADLRRRNVVA